LINGKKNQSLGGKTQKATEFKRKKERKNKKKKKNRSLTPP
jgi:hypothetical protein